MPFLPCRKTAIRASTAISVRDSKNKKTARKDGSLSSLNSRSINSVMTTGLTAVFTYVYPAVSLKIV